MKSKTTLLLIIFAVFLGWNTAHAKRGYGDSGCGLGSMIIGEGSGFTQIFAMSTNNSTYTQTFGITTGTSNCVPDDKLARMDKEGFIQGNLMTFSKEAAQGSGETIAAFSRVLGCNESAIPIVANRLKHSHAKVFSTNDPSTILDVVYSELRQEPEAVRDCSELI